MRENIEQVLNDLKKQKLREFFLELDPFFKDILFGATVPQDHAVRAVGRFASEMVYEAVALVLPISRSTSAFAQIDQSVGSFFLELCEELPYAIDPSWTDATVQRLERQLDNYRPEFAAGSATTTGRKSLAGRNPKYDWVTAINAVWGKLYRAELTPEKDLQVGIERALLQHFSMLGEELEVSTVRPYARDVFREATRKD